MEALAVKSTAPARRRRTDWGPSYVLWWLAWLVVLFWPLLVGGLVFEVIWLVLAGTVAALAVTGRRQVARRRR